MNHDSIESSSSQEPSQSERSEPQRPVLGGKELMSWTIKALPQPTLFMDIGFGIIFILGVIAFVNGAYETYVLDLPFKEKSIYFQMDTGIICMVIISFLWKKAVRQKNIYHYRITDEGGEVEYHIDFPEGAGVFFTILSVVFLVFVLGLIAYNPSFIWMLVGPVGMGIVAARFFLNFEVEKHYGGFRWDRPNWVIIDKKRKLVVVKRRPNSEVPFAENYLNFDAFLPVDQIPAFVEIAKKYAPPNTDFEEMDWKF